MRNSELSWVAQNPKKTGLVIFVTVILISLLIIDRLLNYIQPLEKPDKSYIVREIHLREHHPRLETTYNFKGQNYLFRIDENGFILPHNTHENPDYEIVFIGGSTTECMYVTENNRFPFLVGKILEENNHSLINSYNAAVAGNNSIHSLDLLINKIIPMNPDIVVFMHAINDYTTLAYDHTYWSIGTSRSVIVTLKGSNEKETFYWHFKGFFRSMYPNIYQKIFDIKHRIINGSKSAKKQDEWAGRRHNVKDRSIELMEKEFEWALNMLISTTKSRGITPVLMTQANLFNTIPDDKVPDETALVIKAGLNFSTFKKEYRTFNDITRKVAEDNEVYLIDLENIFPKDSTYFYDQIHYNDKGSKYVASMISEHLANIINIIGN